ncbi:MAG: GNAT family N-acetyltransferase [Clostridia bacterium]|nr:GNAT family N-acetyltransferase [Clostridia bacterium]
MIYEKTVRLKDGRECVIRNGTEKDGQALLDVFNAVHAQTDFLLTYPDEHSYTAEKEAEFLRSRTESPDEIELLALVDGAVVGSAGIGCVGRKDKLRHRAEFGISVDRAFWGLGIGRAMTEACIECAGRAGYAQLELDVVADNSSAISLYESVGFREFGRNPKGFRSRFSGWQELVLMRLELEK